MVFIFFACAIRGTSYIYTVQHNATEQMMTLKSKIMAGFTLSVMAGTPNLAGADEVYSTWIGTTEGSDDILTVETDLHETTSIDLYDFRDTIRSGGEPDETLFEHWDLSIECLTTFPIIECVTFPPVFGPYGEFISPGWSEERLHRCVDGQWTTTVYVVESC